MEAAYLPDAIEAGERERGRNELSASVITSVSRILVRRV